MAIKISSDELEELVRCFELVEDPRETGRSTHSLIDIIVLSICAVLSGAESCADISEFGRQKYTWLKQYLDLSGGIPSHDTIARVLSIISPTEFEASFFSWTQTLIKGKKNIKSVSIDGKCISGTERHFPKVPLHLVNVYCHELGLALAQTKAPGQGIGELNGALDCIKLLDLKGVNVLADAGLSQRKVAAQIRSQGGDYMLPIKGNQKISLRELEQVFDLEKGSIERVQTIDQEHARYETRVCELLKADHMSKEFKHNWIDVQVILRITRTRRQEDKVFTKVTKDIDGSLHYSKNDRKKKEETSVTYYIASRNWNATEALSEVRKHWGIENNLHWVLDMAFGEDDWRVRAKSLARNLSAIRKIAYNIVRSSKTTGSIRGRIKKAGWNNDFLGVLVFGTAI